MARHKDKNWNLKDGPGLAKDQVVIAILMDLRDELKTLNKVLRQVSKNTAWSRTKRKSE